MPKIEVTHHADYWQAMYKNGRKIEVIHDVIKR
jgi:hypothetical protein